MTKRLQVWIPWVNAKTEWVMHYLSSTSTPLRCLWAKHWIVSPVELCTGFSQRLWLYWAAPRLDECNCVKGVAGKKEHVCSNPQERLKTDISTDTTRPPTEDCNYQSNTNKLKNIPYVNERSFTAMVQSFWSAILQKGFPLSLQSVPQDVPTEAESPLCYC